MFRVVDHIDVDWPVQVPWVDETGADVQAAFFARFRLLPAARVEELQEAARLASSTGEAGREYLADRAYFAEILVGWRDVADADGQPLPFSAANRDLLVGLPRVGFALMLAYGQARSGLKRGN